MKKFYTVRGCLSINLHCLTTSRSTIILIILCYHSDVHPFRQHIPICTYIQYHLCYIQYYYILGMRCGPRQEYSLPTAIIVSPQYPLAHKPTEDCEYEITVQPDHQLILTTLHMNLESSADCSKVDDAVIEVSKRSDPASEYQKVTRLCGKENYAPYTIRNSSHVLLRFSSGYLNEGQFRQGQFKLRYEQVPENQYFLL